MTDGPNPSAAALPRTIESDPDHEAIRARLDSAGAHNNLGFALVAQGQLDEAIASYRQALRLRPDYAEAWQNVST